MAQDINFTRDGAIGLVTLNRPEVLNAMREQSIRDLGTLIEHLAGDEGLKVLVITGAGRGFCAGEDLKELENSLKNASGRQHVHKQVSDLQDITRKIAALGVPIIAAINGPAVGFGAELSLNCDIRIAARSAYIGFPEVSRGLSITNGGLYFLRRLVGRGAMMELLLTGELLSAEHARSIGLVNRVVADHDLLNCTFDLANKIGSQSPASLRVIKRDVNDCDHASLEQALQIEASSVSELILGGDFNEGVRALREKRAPKFS